MVRFDLGTLLQGQTRIAKESVMDLINQIRRDNDALITMVLGCQ